jgi:hypothetical protein
MVLGWIILISIIIAIVFGWEFMMDMWTEIFDYVREFAGVILDRAKESR